MFLRRLTAICFLVTMLRLICPEFVYAYLDPGTGSYVFQLLLASLVGFLFVVAAYWKRIKEFLAGLFSKEIEAPLQDSETDDHA